MPTKPPKSAPPGPAFTPAKKALFALFAVIFIPLLLLLAAELALRLGGYGYPTSFFLERTISGEKYLTENDKFGWRFFPKELARSPTATRFQAAKPPGTTRIFVFGESAALGDPKPAYSFGRYLEVLLRERYPTTKFEVITVAMTAINSHAIVPIARECARLQGDFWVIYMGNNEMMGPFGANPVSGPAAPGLGRIRAIVALRASRLGQLAESALASLKKDQSRTWEGMKTFLAHQVPPQAPERDRVRENFQANLEAIVRLANRSGAKPVVSTVAGNLKDCAPFASMHGPQVGEPERHRIAALLQTNSIESMQAAAKADELFAETHFRLGHAALSAGDGGTAFEALSKARDYDALPFRTDAMMNAAIRAAARDAILADVEREFAKTSAGGLPGEEAFFDHVHFTFEGNYRVALIIATALAPNLSANPGGEWPSFDLCNRELGLTSWNRRAAAEHMLQRLSEPPFTTQSNHAAREDSLARRIVQDRASATPDARAIYEAALAKAPHDFRMHENFAEFLELSGDFAGAARQWRVVSDLLPHQHSPLYQAGRLVARERKHDEARQLLRQALALRPDLAEALVELGQISYREGNHADALALYEQALRLRPQDSRLRMHQADALAASGDRGAAMGKLREAIQLRPSHWEPRYLLAVELAATNRIPEAIQEFQEVTRLRPDYAQARFNLGVALAKSGRLQEAYAEFRKTLEIDPAHRSANEYVKMIEDAARK